MEHPQDKTQLTACDIPLPELEGPMINTMVACLGIEHRKLNDLIMRLACAATRLANDPGAVTANERALQVRDEIQHALRSHLQIEDADLLGQAASRNFRRTARYREERTSRDAQVDGRA